MNRKYLKVSFLIIMLFSMFIIRDVQAKPYFSRTDCERGFIQKFTEECIALVGGMAYGECPDNKIIDAGGFDALCKTADYYTCANRVYSLNSYHDPLVCNNTCKYLTNGTDMYWTCVEGCINNQCTEEAIHEMNCVDNCELIRNHTNDYFKCMCGCHQEEYCEQRDESQDFDPGDIDEQRDPENNNGYSVNTGNYLDPYDRERIGDNFCDTEEVIRGLKVVGMLLFIAKIFVPLIIIGLGIFDIYKSVSSGNSEAVSKQTKVLIKRVFIGIIIFFIPTILRAIFNFNGSYNELEQDNYNCFEAVLNPMDM